MENMQPVFAIIFGIIFMSAFIFSMAVIISPKFRGKLMARQFKSMKYMVGEAKDDIEYITKEGIKMSAHATKEGLDEAKDEIEQATTTMAEATKEGLKTTAKALKEGLTEDDTIHCKHCGEVIDNDSKFCKKCGKEQ